MPVRTSSRMPNSFTRFSMAEALLSSPIMARVSVVGETSMIDARKMFAIWMTRFPISLVGTLTLMRISSRRMAFSGCSSFTECTGSSLRRVIRRADSQRFDVVALAGKQARNLGKHAGFVVHQNGQGTSYCAVHVHPSFNR